MKSKFLLDPDVIFLNHGSFGATPRPVFDVYLDWQRKLEKQPVLFLGRELQGYLEQARISLGHYLNTNPNNLVYIPNATFGINIIARSLDLGQGDEILITNHEYGACQRVWRFICKKTGASLIKQAISLPVKDDDDIVDQLWRGVSQRTKLIFVSHISSPTALAFPIEEICARARQNDIPIMIDGAHAPGQTKVDLQAIGADYYTGNCHKWMMAPKGSAFLYVRPERQLSIEPLIVSWGWEPEPNISTGSQFLDYLQTWGTRDHSACLSVPAAIQFQIDYKWEEVRARCHNLLKYVVHKMTEITGLNDIYSGSEGFFHQMAALPLPEDVDTLHLKDFLYETARIEIPCYQWEGHPYIRISVQGYNSAEEIEQFLLALKFYISHERRGTG